MYKVSDVVPISMRHMAWLQIGPIVLFRTALSAAQCKRVLSRSMSVCDGNSHIFPRVSGPDRNIS